jgi:hypothetical protein
VSAVRALKRKPASQPARRTVTVALHGEYEGWECVARADFKAKRIIDLNSGDYDRVISALDGIILTHNFPDAEEADTIAASMADVELDAVGEVIEAIFDAIKQLPPR